MGAANTYQDFEQQLKDDFLVEAAELLAQTETLFLLLEKDPSQSNLIDNIFRIVHTIKGSGGVAGFKGLAAFAHVFETLLGKLRSGEVMISDDVIDVMLGGVDILNQFVTKLRADHGALVDCAAAVARIDTYINPTAVHAQSDDTTSSKAQATPPPAPLAAKGPRKPLILVVDDEPSAVIIMGDHLRSAGYEVVSAGNGAEAVAILDARNDIDLLVTDQRMPDMSGSEVIEYLRNKGNEIPVIVVSGAANRDDAIKFLKLGVFDFFEKPFLPQKFTLTVANAIRLRTLKINMEEVYKLSIRSYLTFRKILEVVETENPKVSSHPAIQKYSGFLEEMGAIIASSVEAKKPQS